MTKYCVFPVPDIELIDLEAEEDQNQVPVAQGQPNPAPPAPQVQGPPPQVQPPPPEVLPAPAQVQQAAAQPTPGPARRGRRRRGGTVETPTPARRGRTEATEGENSRGTRPTRTSARYAFYGNGDSEDDFIDP